MRIALLLVCTLLLGGLAEARADDAQNPPAPAVLFLTPQRLRRLQRDRERQTVRWVNFEKRVNMVSDSPERGFELALYYAVTHDQARGKEAVAWALAHPCNKRQVTLIVTWASELIGPQDRDKLSHTMCDAVPPNEGVRARDALFDHLFRGSSIDENTWPRLLQWLKVGHFSDSDALYAACEYLSAVRSTQQTDPRQDAPEFFSALPSEFLLALRPEDVERPSATMHIAALALISLDPNLPGSQYLQGWAMSEAQTLREGEGVAYEFLWADPYLPGVAYQNLDPWVYDKEGRLFARTGWEIDACWVAISATGVTEQHCTPGWRQKPVTFGHLILLPVTATCTDIPPRTTDQTIMVWRLDPNAAVTVHQGKKPLIYRADKAGLLMLLPETQGKVCQTR